MISAIIIVISAITSLFGFLGLMKKKDKLDEAKQESVAFNKMDWERHQALRKAGSIGAVTLGAAGIAAGAYYYAKNRGQNFRQQPQAWFQKNVSNNVHVPPFMKPKKRKKFLGLF